MTYSCPALRAGNDLSSTSPAIRAAEPVSAINHKAPAGNSPNATGPLPRNSDRYCIAGTATFMTTCATSAGLRERVRRVIGPLGDGGSGLLDQPLGLAVDAAGTHSSLLEYRAGAVQGSLLIVLEPLAEGGFALEAQLAEVLE